MIRRSLIFLSRLTVLIFKALFLIITGFRKLKVERVVVNNAFLLSNGLLVLHWRVRNVLWVRVQGKWVGGRASQVMVLKMEEMPAVVSIYIQGLLSHYRRRFVIYPLAGLQVGEPVLSLPGISVVPDALCPMFTPILNRWELAGNWGFIADVGLVEIHLPIFQTETIYETRLLQ